MLKNPSLQNIEQDPENEVYNGESATINLEGLPPDESFTVFYNINDQYFFDVIVNTDSNGNASFETNSLWDWVHDGKDLTITNIVNNNSGCENDFEESTILNIAGWPLPIELAEFYVECLYNNTVKVFWKTLSEYNNDFFILKRSTDMHSFNTVATINGQGFSNNINDYIHIDTVKSGVNYYYSLTQVDFDGRYKEFPVISTICHFSDSYNNEEPIEIFPNPVSKELNISLKDFEYVVNDIYVYCRSGVLKKHKSVSTSENIGMDVSSLDLGTYFVRIHTSVRPFNLRFNKH